mgnify:CR=1 FL=1
MEGHRAERISEALREELDELIGYEMSDPRVESVTVSEVVLSPDARKAQVRLKIPGDDQRQRDAINALEHARNFLRTELSHRLHMYRLPDLRFEADASAGVGGRIDFLMRRIKRGRPRDAEGGRPHNPEGTPAAGPASGEKKPQG